MRLLAYIVILLMLSSSSFAYYAQKGNIEVRTKIDLIGIPKTTGAISTDYVSGGEHPVTSDFTNLTGRMGAFDLANRTVPPPPPVIRRTGGGSGGGAPSIPNKIIVMSEDQLTTLVKPSDTIEFNIENRRHEIVINSISSVTFTVDQMYQYTINLGETQSIDVTGDRIADLSITVQSIMDNSAMITLKKLPQTQSSMLFDLAPREEAPNAEIPKETVQELVRAVKIEKDIEELPKKEETKLRFDYIKIGVLALLSLVVIIAIILIISRMGRNKGIEQYSKQIDELRKKYGLDEYSSASSTKVQKAPQKPQRPRLGKL